MKTVVLCASASFYEHTNQIAEDLQKLGYNVVVPKTARKMKQSGDYDIAKVKTWMERPEDFGRKHDLAMAHFNEVANGDAILIVNDDKPDWPNYIGPNGCMEWGLAYYLGKPVFVLNGVDKDSNLYEEVYGMATVINGDLTKIKL